MRRPKTKHPSLDNRLNAAPRPWIRNSQTPPKSELRYSKPSSGNSQTLPKSELRYRKKGLVCKIHAQGAPNGFEDRGPFSTFEPAKSKELERDGWMGYGVEALPSSTVGDSAAETRPTARIRNGRTTARFMPKGRLMGLRTGGLSAPSNQLKAKSWREMDGWGIEALPSSTVGDAAAETPPRARFRTPARFMPKRCLMGLRTGGRSAPSNQLIAKSWREMDGWGIEALPSSTVGDSAAETPPRPRLRNGRTPAKFELRHSKKQYVRRVQNSTFGAP